ncbi:hypothetical protein BC829DRAFT_403229 [Chytridium lagenaria]|nr:hypothetical protein BC829DRAFT_403229 [Chytridium lagenaria]
MSTMPIPAIMAQQISNQSLDTPTAPTIAPPGSRTPSTNAVAPFLDFPPPPTVPQPALPGFTNMAQSTQMTLDMAMRDTPAFRASLNGFEAELEGISRWLEGLTRGTKAYAEDLGRSNEVVANLIQRLRNRRRVSILDSTVVHTFSEALQTVCALRSKLMETLNLDMVSLIHKFLKEDIKEMKDFDKAHAKITERYDQALAKYASLPKTKEASALREDAFILFEARKTYIRSSIEYAYKILVFKNNMEMLIVDRLMGAMYAHGAFFETSSDVFKGIKPSMNALKGRLEETRRTLPTATDIEQKKRAIEEEAINRANPAPTPYAGNLSAVDLSSLNEPSTARQMVTTVAAAAAAAASANLAVSPGCNTGTPTEKEGHLFRRITTGAKGWTRCYVILTDGQLYIQTVKQGPDNARDMIVNGVEAIDYAVDSVLNAQGIGAGISNGITQGITQGIGGNTSTAGKKAGKIVTVGPISVLLCGTRVDKLLDRRFCFEIFTPMKTFTLQAETEKEMFDWVASIESAKSVHLTPPSGSHKFHSGGETTDADDDILRVPGEHRSVKQALSLPLQPRESYELPGRPSTMGRPPNMEMEEDDEDEDDAVIEVAVEEDGKRAGTAKDFFFEDRVTGEVRYPDPVWEKRDRELHHLLKSVPKTDHVIDVFSVALQKELVLQGKIYLTQNRICFHSNILGFVNVLVIHLTSIKSIVKVKSGPFHSSINVETFDFTYSFKTFLKDDTKIFGAIRTSWQNSAKLDKDTRMTSQELFDHVFSTYHKLDEKEKSSRKSTSALDGKEDSSHQLVGGDESGDGAGDVKKDVEGEDLTDEYSLPPTLSPPASEPVCGCGDAGHLEKQDFNGVFQVPAKRLFDLMFGVNSDNANMYEKYHKQRGENSRQMDQPTGVIATREGQWMMPFNNPMVKLKEARVDEMAFLIKRVDYFVYVVECRSQTPDVPYGDNFSPMTRYCITWINKDTCRMKAFTGIRCEGAKGMAKGIADLTAALKAEIEIINARSGKVASTGTKPGEAVASTETAATTVNDTSGAVTKPKEAESWGIVALLTLSLMSNLSGWIWGGRREVVVPGVEWGSESSLAQCGWGTKWEKELSRSDSVDHNKAMLAFLTSHFEGPHPDLLTNTTTLKDGTKWTPTRPRTDVDVSTKSYHYHKRFSTLTPKRDTAPHRHRLAHAKMSEMHDDIVAAREEALRTLRLLDEAERALMWARYWNWVADGVGAAVWSKGKEEEGERMGKVFDSEDGVGGVVGGVRGIRKLMEHSNMI